MSVYSFRDNPAVDRPLVRKSLEYCQMEVKAGRAHWIGADPGQGIQTLSPEEISRRSREPRIPSLGGHTSISAAESRLNAESPLPVTIPDDERKALLLAMSIRIEQQIERALSEGRPIPHLARVLNSSAKMVAFPITHESCNGAKATPRPQLRTSDELTMGVGGCFDSSVLPVDQLMNHAREGYRLTKGLSQLSQGWE